MQFQISLLDLFILESGFIEISALIDYKCSLCYTQKIMTRLCVSLLENSSLSISIRGKVCR